jgi:radical SAM protein with 4Fe4S-binding SPASM domain
MIIKIKRLAKKTFVLYDRYGLKGLFLASMTKLESLSLPLIYKNYFLRRLYHPKLQIVFLELTNNCNLRCKMCKWQERQEKGCMSKELFTSCINQFSENGLQVLNLQFGGESLLHNEFSNFLKYAIEQRDMGKIGSIGLTDNGMLFNQNIADLFVSLKVDWINFSLDGLGEVNDNIRLGSKYLVIEKNIKYLLKKRSEAKKPTVLLNMVDYGKTDRQKLDFFNEWVSLVDGIELIPSILPNNTWEKDCLSPNIKIAPPPAFCSSPLNTMVIGWDGKVTGCCFDSNIEMNLGDVKTNSIMQIWRGKKFQELRKEILSNKFPNNSPCKGCDFWKVNFEPGYETILNGKARIEYSGGIRKIRRAN